MLHTNLIRVSLVFAVFSVASMGDVGAQAPIDVGSPVLAPLATDPGLAQLLIDAGIISVVVDPGLPSGFGVAVDCLQASLAVDALNAAIDDAYQAFLAAEFEYLFWQDLYDLNVAYWDRLDTTQAAMFAAMDTYHDALNALGPVIDLLNDLMGAAGC